MHLNVATEDLKTPQLASVWLCHKKNEKNRNRSMKLINCHLKTTTYWAIHEEVLLIWKAGKRHSFEQIETGMPKQQTVGLEITFC